MDAALVLAGLAMGVAATPHCALMCSAPCAAASAGGARHGVAFQFGRAFGYAAGGALAAGSMALLGAWSQAAPALRPLWTALHLALLALGLWWLATGATPAWLRRGGAAVPMIGVGSRPARPPWRAGLFGLGWVAWPCGVLQAALLLAALASSAAGGALVMAAFALGSTPALVAAPWAWQRWRAATGRPQRAATWDLRLAGAGVVLASGWALTHGLWQRLAAFCFG